MNNLLRHTWVQISLLVALVLVVVAVVAAYALSFHAVTFEFDSRVGHLELSQQDTKLYPVSGRPLKLKAGDYTVRSAGTNIEPSPHTLTVDSSKTIAIKFSYTAAHLRTLYTAEKPTIETTLKSAYPRIDSLYRIAHGQLYGLGDICGVSLVAIDQSSDNADTLRALLRKKNGTWHVVSTPPTPLLGAPDYPGVSVEILRSINQAK